MKLYEIYDKTVDFISRMLFWVTIGFFGLVFLIGILIYVTVGF